MNICPLHHLPIRHRSAITTIARQSQFAAPKLTRSRHPTTETGQQPPSQGEEGLKMSNAAEYLKHYRELSKPGYAVLITGEWGSGKTHFVTSQISDRERWYVSLFGMKDTSEVHAAVLAAMDPEFAATQRAAEKIGKAADIAGGAIAGGARFLSFLATEAFRSEIDPTKGILVFDDLERSKMSAQELLGAINLYVEHRGCRVVLVAHDGKIERDFKEANEKVVGQTIRVEANVDEALECFITELKGQACESFVREHLKAILDIFLASGSASLRSLRRLVMDIARLHQVIDDDLISNNTAMNELIRLTAAFAIEVREGRLREDDLSDRAGAKMIHHMKERSNEQSGDQSDQVSVSAFVASAERYEPLVNLESDLLDDGVLVAMHIKGEYNGAEISRCIRTSIHVTPISELRPWYVIVNRMEVSLNDFEGAIERQEADFIDRSVIDLGDMSHMFMVRFALAARGIIPKTFDILEAETVAYIDDLHTDGLLPEFDIANELRGFDFSRDSHSNYRLWIEPEYEENAQRVKAHLALRREQAFAGELDVQPDAILDVVAEDPNAFLERFVERDENPGRYADRPFLARVDPESFVEAWLRGDGGGRRTVASTLRSRHRYHHDGKLADEKLWLVKVLEIYDQRVAAAAPLEKMHIENLISPEFRAHIGGYVTEYVDSAAEE